MEYMCSVWSRRWLKQPRKFTNSSGNPGDQKVLMQYEGFGFFLKVSCRSIISGRQSIKVTSHKSPVDKKMPKGPVWPFSIQQGQQNMKLHSVKVKFLEHFSELSPVKLLK